MPFAQVMRSGWRFHRALDEPVAAPREARDDLVRHEQHAGVATHLARGLQIAGRRWVDAAGTDHGLAEERGHALRAEVIDRCAELSGVVPCNLGHVGDQPAVTVGVCRDPGEARPGGVHAVIRVLALQQHGSAGLTPKLPMAPHDLRRGVDRVGATAREEHVAPRNGRTCADAVHEGLRRTVRQIAERGVAGQLPHLRGDGVGDLSATEPDVAEPESRGRIQVAAAAFVPHVDALAALKDERSTRLDRRHVGEGMPEVAHVRGRYQRHARAPSARQANVAPRVSPARTRGSRGATARPRRGFRPCAGRSPRPGPSRADRR